MRAAFVVSAIATTAAACALVAGLDAEYGAADGADAAPPYDAGAEATQDEPVMTDAPVAVDAARYACDGGGVSDDPRNCGRAGHDCFGGACRACACQAYTIADDLAPPAGIAFASVAGAVYWTSGPTDAGQGAVLAYTPDDGGTRVIASSANPGEIVADTTNVYWADPGDGLLRTALDGSTKYVVSGIYNARNVGLDVTTDVIAVTLTNGTLYACQAPYCTLLTDVVPSGAASYGGVAVVGDVVVWTDIQNGQVAACKALTCNVSPDFPYTIMSNVVSPRGLAAYKSSVYFLAEGVLATSGKLYGSDVTSPGPVEMATALPRPRNVAVDNSGVYFTTYDDGLVRRCPATLAKCTPEIIAAGPLHASYIALDPSRVYWTIPEGKVMAVAKP